ncbi:carbohydrate porin [Pseudomonas sp. Z18(2022)]|uniref:carbohydrate porin n=1 Tax=Pseudomonas sp. Z18(2022) TaxID=2983410 RepID=UPI002E810418|nr:carbohydrate porin [Pseudomonas sp. Z18(2022)]
MDTKQLFGLIGVACLSLQIHAENIDASVQSASQIKKEDATKVEAPMRLAAKKMLEDQGNWLNDRGISPSFSITQFALENPSAGRDKGQYSGVTIFSLGGHLDMSKIAGIPGGTIHFDQWYAPFVNNPDYPLLGGTGIVAGGSTPYLPRVSHLVKFTYEQKLLDDTLTLEAGKSNAGDYFGLPVCNNILGCVNTLLQYGGINAPAYSNWGARVAYNYNSRFRAQLGAWRYYPLAQNTNGWESAKDGLGGKESTIYLANLLYQTSMKEEAYPQSYEVMLFRNNGTQTDPYYTVNGDSKVLNPTVPVRERSNASGFYVSVKKAIWREDAEKLDMTMPTSVSLYGSVAHNLNDKVGTGLATQVNAGVLLSSPFHSRPLDTYSLNMNWVQLTSRKQKFLEDAHEVSNSGGSYSPGRNEYSLGIDANFVLTDSLVAMPFIYKTWGTSAYLDPFGQGNPSSGIYMGITLHLQIDELLGLNPQRRR